MPRWFNTAGPCKPDIHYMLSPLERLPKLASLVEQQSYFVIYAPRQTGKTTAMLALAQQLTASGKYTALMVSAEAGAPFHDDITAAEQAIIQTWSGAARAWLPEALQFPPFTPGEGSRISQLLQH